LAQVERAEGRKFSDTKLKRAWVLTDHILTIRETRMPPMVFLAPVNDIGPSECASQAWLIVAQFEFAADSKANASVLAWYRRKSDHQANIPIGHIGRQASFFPT
jgi:hypothetical protein